MPDNTNPAAKPEPASVPDEFEFDMPTSENPRLKRRSLKAKPTAPLTPVKAIPPLAQELEREAPPHSAETAIPEHNPPLDPDNDAEINAAVKFTEPLPASAPTSSTTTKPSPSTTGYTPRTTSSTNQPASPHGTRPANLYYSTSPRKDKDESPPMKPTTPTSGPTSSPARSTTAPAARPATVVDYRTNIERQAREQKSVGGVLSIVVYVLIALFVLGASLSGYGLYAISKQLKAQSLTMDDLNRSYTEKNQTLTAQLNTTIETLTKAQAQIGREQELILQQQEAINKIITANDATSTALRQEKQSRASETASLRARVNNLENRTQPR